MIFPKSEYKILRLIYENSGIRLTELMKKAQVSAATAKKRLEPLISSGVITEEKIMGGKRVLLKNFHPHLNSEEGRNVFYLIEAEKKQEFFTKNKNLIGPFKQLLKNAEGNIKIVLVFGSFAAFSQTKDSDLDLLFLAKGGIDKSRLKKEIERSFVTFGPEISPRIDTLVNFKRNLYKSIYNTIVKNHIVVKGGLEYIKLIS